MEGGFYSCGYELVLDMSFVAEEDAEGDQGGGGIENFGCFFGNDFESVGIDVGREIGRGAFDGKAFMFFEDCE